MPFRSFEKKIRNHFSIITKNYVLREYNNFWKIALEVGKPQIAIEDYAAAFWDDNMGKKRFSENEYDRAVKTIERGKKKLKDFMYEKKPIISFQTVNSIA